LDSAALAWFRRDLRVHDAAALHAALSAHGAVHCVFVFDTEILDALPERADRRVDFIWRSVAELKAGLKTPSREGIEKIEKSIRETQGWANFEVADATEQYLVGAREILRRRAEATRLSQQAAASRAALLAHMDRAPRRDLPWIRAATDLKKQVERDHFDLDVQLGAIADLLGVMPEANKRLAVRRNVVSTALVSLGTIGYYGAYAVIIYLTVMGRFTIGSLTFLAGSFRQSRDLIQRILLSLSQIYEQSLYLRDLFGFFEVRPRVLSRPGARPVPVPIARGFEFHDVGFRYPGSDRWAVRHLTFTIGPAERVALVGENGAGKTTLVKLLARLYDPDEGRILLDGIDLRDYDLASLWKNVGVIFQDFVRYDFVLRENIGVSQIEALADEARILEAARRSLAESVARRLAKGYEQMLGRRFEGGVELSGGEWQKIALGRAYLREAQVLILDEPTAALDARAEYEVFLRFAELTRGKMAVLISHRFSTVRMADRILVLKDGELVEQGTHEELVGAGGLYAELFSLQAAGYR